MNGNNRIQYGICYVEWLDIAMRVQGSLRWRTQHQSKKQVQKFDELLAVRSLVSYNRFLSEVLVHLISSLLFKYCC